jgi:hypothetical protein
MSPTIVVTLVLTMMTAGQQYERNMPMDSMGQCLSEATRVLNEAAKLRPRRTGRKLAPDV